MSNVFDLGSTNVALALDCPFPSNVNSGPGITVNKAGGTWDLSLDYMPLSEETTPVPGNVYGAFYDTAVGLYEKIRMDNLIAAATGLDTRQPIVDANYNVTVHDRYVALTMALTAPRLVTMPPAASVPGGREVQIEDEVGGVSSPNYLGIVPTGTDTISGRTGVLLATPYGGVKLRSNGTNAWNVVATTSFYLLPAGVVNYTATLDDNVVGVPSFSAPVTITLPPAVSYPKGRRFTVADNNGFCGVSNTITVRPQGSDTINMSSNPPIATLNAPSATITLVSDGVSRWTVIGGGNITAAVTVTSAQISDASPLGRQILTNPLASTSRAALGSSSIGDAVFTAATPTIAQSALGLGTMSTQAANGVNITGGTISSVALTGGTINGSAITGATLGAVTANGAITLSPNNANVAVSPTGTGAVTISPTGSGSVTISPTGSGSLTVNPTTPGHMDNVVIGATVPAAFSATSLNGGQLAGHRNMIINGRGVIDQRNNNGSTTLGGGGGYFGDRWAYYGSQASKFSLVCGANIGGMLNGATKYLNATVAAVYTPVTNDVFQLYQLLEGLIAARLGWGTPAALPATFSFDVNANVAGTYCVRVGNSNSSRVYVAPFTVSTANTWTHIALTIPGDTAGTWPSDNTYGIGISWILGYGPNYVGTGNVWGSSNILATAGSVNLVTQSGGSFNVTNVQFEQGTVATPFENRLQPVELLMCQRYHERMWCNARMWQPGVQTIMGVNVYWVPKRTNPTATLISAGSRSNIYSVSLGISGSYSGIYNIVATAAGDCYAIADYYAIDAEL